VVDEVTRKADDIDHSRPIGFDVVTEGKPCVWVFSLPLAELLYYCGTANGGTFQTPTITATFRLS
jgi:hypothetical protein